MDIVKAYGNEFNQLVDLYEKHTNDKTLDNPAVAIIIVIGNKIVELNSLKDFNISSKTMVGRINVIIDLELLDYAKAKLRSKIYVEKNDTIDIKEILKLNGKYVLGIAKSTVVATDFTHVNIINETYGTGECTKDHIECNKIIKGQYASVSTISVLKVENEKSGLTHKASVGRISHGQLETFMARELSKNGATQIIVNGLLS